MLNIFKIDKMLNIFKIDKMLKYFQLILQEKIEKVFIYLLDL